MKKQTAVEWLVSEIKSQLIAQVPELDLHSLQQQAKAMEREQMVYFALNCQEMFKHQIEERYIETYKGGEQ